MPPYWLTVWYFCYSLQLQFQPTNRGQQGSLVGQGARIRYTSTPHGTSRLFFSFLFFVPVLVTVGGTLTAHRYITWDMMWICNYTYSACDDRYWISAACSSCRQSYRRRRAWAIGRLGRMVGPGINLGRGRGEGGRWGYVGRYFILIDREIPINRLCRYYSTLEVTTVEVLYIPLPIDSTWS